MRREPESEDGNQSFFDGVADTSLSTPEDIVLKAELEAAADELVGAFIDSLEDDLLVEVVGEIVDGARKPKEIAESLAVEITKVYNARKRLRRRLADFLDAQVAEEVHND